jgi:glycosyltransferase involved in cell wall biosynthesis
MNMTTSPGPIDFNTELKDEYHTVQSNERCEEILPFKETLKISVITVSYNSASTIADTLVSVQSQIYSNVEHILVDGKSSDHTASIIESFPHVARFISEKDNGIYDAINKGLEVATGDIIGILHSDDVYCDEQVLLKVATNFETSNADTLYADLDYVNEKKTNQVIRRWKSGKFKRSKFYYGWMPPHPTFFVKREVYEKVGPYDCSLKNSSDYEMMLRILYKNFFTTTYLPSILVKMRVGGESNSSLRNRIRANKEDRIAWKLNNLHPYFFTLYLKPFRKIFQFINFNFFIRIAILCIKDKV